MKYDMRLLRTPTSTNIAASSELSKQFAKDAVTRIGDAAKALHTLAENPNPTPAETLAAVREWNTAQAAIRGSIVEVLGAAVLGGASVTTAARKAAGIRPQTLSEHLITTVAQFRGSDLVRDGDGWVAVEPAPRPADQQVSVANPDGFGSGPVTGSGRNTEMFRSVHAADSAGAQEVTGGAHAPVGTSGPDPAAVEAAIQAAITEGGA
ncbi:hypothetical protein [Mycobacteroides abscessus]|uniref:hypothetical protein n=1 Tax=Mycobacteroides abscessus TaxID=36809 RepID=UPI00092850EE|nr:hypothetical protein [Mycobacteroides abscessus]MBN7371113.1 hypothetical protein [Mycobacteroides abscessus subsp. abscessus]MBN7521283.1 hypothetical protein [Mycobacteroides abscessus subsp. abscessus]MDB2185151.1 hypothetical protein [Mycobacteroides abscessus subsp. abscessus]MDO3123496.1 hypothetical protein [Mycobacteroides abscessus subsp. abscessus]MDO3173307.1 hypothetical protein [Mycobacteroides abscessus subsp. abscessus]